jgi:hypothetical protein
MPTRKQRRRAAKEKRHEYETVWVDAEGHELEAPPEDAEADGGSRRNGKADAKPAAKAKGKNQKGGRAARTPPPPSWRRAGRRAGLLGAVVFALFYLTSHKNGSSILSVLLISALYTALFIPFTYAVDRYAYTRYLRRTEGGTKQPTKR